MRLRHGLIMTMAVGASCGFGPKEHVTKPCGHVEIKGDEAIKLTTMETRLVCGDPGNRPWATIPRNQASYLMRSFLQTRGYYHPVFSGDDTVLKVDAGRPTEVTSVTAASAPPELDVTRYWRAKGQRLTPKLLNDFEAWVTSQLKGAGYGCPKAVADANPETGDVVVGVASGPRQILAGVTAEEVPGLMSGVLRRNDAFTVGDLFDDDLVTLTTRRTLAKELLLSTHFTETCKPEGVQLHQSTMPGPPRIARVGFGFNTERLFLVRASIRNSRLGNTASVFDLSAEASRPLQLLTASGEWYLLDHPTRFFLQPSLELRREDERAYESRSSKIRLAPATTWDGLGIGVRVAVGPAFEAVSIPRGVGPSFTRITSLDGDAHVMSHMYEFYQGAPRAGYRLDVASTLSRKAWKSEIDAQKIVASAQALWNVADLEPPLLVVGARGGAATTLTGTTDEEFNALPPTWRHYLGGSSTVRGFGRQTLPGGDGALTAVYGGLEVRLASPIPFNLQPFVFTDAGKVGRQAAELSSPLYVSPGLGLRWASPVGPIRVSAARGYVRGTGEEAKEKPSKSAYYFSFGEEF